MKIIFFGLGSIGQRHANILLKEYTHELYAFRSGANEGQNTLNIKEIYSWKEVRKLNPDVAFITNPTSLHIDTAIKCARIGCNLFIEKPIDSKTKDLHTLINIVQEKKLIAYVAYNMRFHPVIKYLKKFLENNKPLHVRVVNTSYYPNWRKGRDRLKTYSAISKMGGGVILDLSHELDYISYLFGNIKKISGNFSKRSNVTLDAEDFVDYCLNCKTAPVNIHINFFSQILQRYIQIDFDKLSIIADLIKAEVNEYSNEKLLKTTKFESDRNVSYESQIKYFFNNINNPGIMNTLREASKLFEDIVKFKKQ